MKAQAPTSCTSLITDFRQMYPQNTALCLKLGEVVISVSTNSFALNHELQDYFKEFIIRCCPDADIQITVHEAPSPDLDLAFTEKKPEPGKPKIKEEYVDLPDGRIVRKRLTGMVFLFTRDEHLAIGPCEANPNQVINFINNRFIQHKLTRGCLLGHAAGVTHAGRGLAMAGFSGMGKSTLALHLMNEGTDFVSNDRVMVEKGTACPRFFGVAKHPRINPGTALNNPSLAGIVAPEDQRIFQDMSTEELWNLEHKYDALIDQCYGADKFILQAPLNGLVILNWQRNDAPTVIRVIDPLERPDLLPAFMKERGLFYLPSTDTKEQDPGVAEYAAQLAGCTVIEISGGVDFETAATACMSFLQTGTVPETSCGDAPCASA